MFYSGIIDAQSRLLVADGFHVYGKFQITSGGLLYLLSDIADIVHIRKIMRCGIQRILTGL